MIHLFRPVMASLFCIGMFGMSGCAGHATVSDRASKDLQTESVPANPIMIDLEAGQVLQFAMFREADGEAAKAIRGRYFRTAIPYARSLGNTAYGALRVRETLIGNQTPNGVALYTFPDMDAMRAYQQAPDWETYEAMRRDAWDELNIVSVVVPSDMQLSFDPSKDYTIAAAWTRPDTLPDYQRYLDGIEADFDQIGARYVAQFNDVDLQSHTDDAGNPSQITLVEWSDGPNLQGLQKTQAYKDHVSDFQTAISRFDLYWVAVPK